MKNKYLTPIFAIATLIFATLACAWLLWQAAPLVLRP